MTGLSPGLDMDGFERKIEDIGAAARSQPHYLDVTHPTANKGVVIERLSRYLKIPLDRIATLGDQPNDVLMFKPSGFSIVMGNAPDEVKRQASAVTDSYEDEAYRLWALKQRGNELI